MDTARTGALAAFGGSSLGALTTVLNNYLLQRSMRQRELLNREIDQREVLYADFIKEASRLYANSIAHNLESLDDLVALYALVSHIRLLASEAVLREAEEFVKQDHPSLRRPQP
jgi:H2-forming N5,N10-methylenetetrahydromethanopterin dehydrogenase-like enzyme